MSLLERLSSRLLVSRVIMSTDQAAQERAHALAAEEGLVLIPADNLSGYKGVTPTQRSNQSSSIGGGFCARVRENGRDVHLGTFPTACEAALCYARHTKVRAKVEAARVDPRTDPYFGKSRRAPLLPMPLLISTAASAPSTEHIEHVDCQAASDDEEGCGGANGALMGGEGPAASSSDGLLVQPTAANGSSSSSAAARPATCPAMMSRKRTRSSSTDEYECVLPLTGDAISIPIPAGVVRGRRVSVSVTFTLTYP